MKPMKKNFRLLVGPGEVAGYYYNLCEGFRELGVKYDFVTIAEHRFGYGGETVKPLLLRMANWLGRLPNNPLYPTPLRLFFALPRKILLAAWAIQMVWRYDAFIFVCGRSLIRNNLDLPLLKLLGKRVISNVGHGSEARPAYINGSHQSKDGMSRPSLEYLTRLTRRQYAHLNRVQKYSTIVIGAPYSTTQFLSVRMINWFALGVPFQGQPKEGLACLDHCAGRQQAATNSAVRILHAPSHSALKGTEQIGAAIEALRKKGHEIEFVLIQNRPFSEVIQEIVACDFVVDQIYSDTPLATFATEAAWFGKPAVVGGYGLHRIKKHVPDDMFPPSKICRPDQIQDAIEDLILNKECRDRLGTEAQQFVQKRWNAVEVAKRYLRLIEGNIPEEWWLEPNAVTYVEGCGQSDALSKENIRLMVERYGRRSLQLTHRPILEKAFLDFAGIESKP